MSEVIARKYETGRALELVAVRKPTRGWDRYIVAVDGQIPDTRRRINTEQAQEFYDSAPYKFAGRPAAR